MGSNSKKEDGSKDGEEKNYVVKSVKITPEMYNFIEEEGYNFSKLIRKYLKKKMEQHENIQDSDLG